MSFIIALRFSGLRLSCDPLLISYSCIPSP
jgi:hypothetical protein